jgi:hypothetical protein
VVANRVSAELPNKSIATGQIYDQNRQKYEDMYLEHTDAKEDTLEMYWGAEMPIEISFRQSMQPVVGGQGTTTKRRER